MKGEKHTRSIKGSQPTYEELKLAVGANSFPEFCRSQPTYEELKPDALSILWAY